MPLLIHSSFVILKYNWIVTLWTKGGIKIKRKTNINDTKHGTQQSRKRKLATRTFFFSIKLISVLKGDSPSSCSKKTSFWAVYEVHCVSTQCTSLPVRFTLVAIIQMHSERRAHIKEWAQINKQHSKLYYTTLVGITFVQLNRSLVADSSLIITHFRLPVLSTYWMGQLMLA